MPKSRYNQSFRWNLNTFGWNYVLWGVLPGCILLFLTFSLYAAESSPQGLARGWKIRGGCNGKSNDFTMLPNMAETGMNSIIVSIGGHFTDVNWKPTLQLQNSPRAIELLNEWRKKTADYGLMYFPLTDLFGTDDRKRWPLERHFVDIEGKELTHTPCPGYEKYWDDKVTNIFVEVARWARDKDNVPGMLVDTEMYGADQVSFRDACFCGKCREEISRELGRDMTSFDTQDEEQLNDYREAYTRRLIPILQRTRAKVSEVNPEFLLGGYLLDYLVRFPDGREFVPPVYKAMVIGWGTADLPVLVFSEATYEPGYYADHVEGKFGQGNRPGYIENWLKIWESWGAHADFVGGLWINRIPDENLAENAYHIAKNTRGYWIYDLLFLGDNRPYRLPGGGAKAYWQALGEANGELAKWLQSEGKYLSPLQIRPYGLPAPGVSVEEWQEPSLPVRQTKVAEPGFYFRGKESLFYIPAQSGDPVELTVFADSAHPTKKKEDVIAIVLVNPKGEVIQREKITIKDLDEQPRADGRYGAQRKVTFTAEQTGTYGLFLNAHRYAYTLGGSSHGWLAAASTWPTPGIELIYPKEFYVKTQGGVKQAKIIFGIGNTQNLEVFSSQGKKLASETISPDGQTVQFDLPAETAQVLKVTLSGGAQAALTGVEGLAPYIASVPGAPFPEF